jgi:hypothetical protein
MKGFKMLGSVKRIHTHHSICSVDTHIYARVYHLHGKQENASIITFTWPTSMKFSGAEPGFMLTLANRIGVY